LLHSAGDSPCLLGKNWGYDDAGVWVSSGCGREFVVGVSKDSSGLSNFVGMFEPYGAGCLGLPDHEEWSRASTDAPRRPNTRRTTT
jgi:hypothetical protein